MAEIFGAVAGGMAVCGQLKDLGIWIYEATKRIKNSRRDVLELSDEAVIFAGLCEDFLRTCEDDYRTKKSVRRLFAWLKQTQIALSNLFEKVKVLSQDSEYHYSFQEICIAYWDWFASKNLVKGLRASLRIAGIGISGFSNLMCIRKLNKELQMLRLALTNADSRREMEKKLGMKIEEKMKVVQRAIELKDSVHDTNKRILDEAKKESALEKEGKGSSDSASLSDDLMAFTYSLNSYAREVLPSTRSRRRSARSRTSVPKPESLYAAASPPRWRSQDSDSYFLRSPIPIPHNTVVLSGQAAPSNVSTSTRSSDSIPPSATRQDITPSVPSTNHRTVRSMQVTPRQNEKTSSSPRNDRDIVEYPDVKSREYMNNPAGNILSCPKTKDPVKKPPETKAYLIGRHMIMLSATELRIDNQSLKVTFYEVADAFFEALLQHEDKIGSLVEVLGSGNENVVWNGIPGWLATSRRVTREALD